MKNKHRDTVIFECSDLVVFAIDCVFSQNCEPEFLLVTGDM